MKSIFRITFFLALTFSQPVFSQVTDKSLYKCDTMDNVKNKETIHFLYYSILNKKHFEKLSEVVSSDYSNTFGGKGVEGFQKTIFELSKAFPDAQWKVEEIIDYGNKILVKQKFSGTQTNAFQNIEPTNKSVTVDGIATYELQNGKIIRSHVQTDRLDFLQQLGVLPTDISAITIKKEISNAVYFIDKFTIPKTSIEEFKKQMNYNREYIKSLSGYVNGDAFEQYDSEGNLTILTIAVWENQNKLDVAKTTVQAEFKRIGFNPPEFYQRLNIKMERGQYKSMEE